MRKLNLEQLKKARVEFLDVVVKFCDEHNIGYFLNFGTLLGAVRHKGYIPWDDDIDIGMLRPDYDKFMAAFDDYNPRYACRCVDKDPQFGLLSGIAYDKRGVGIDIFCLDNAPDDERALKRMCARYFFYRILFGAKFRRISDKFLGRPFYQRVLGRILCAVMHSLPISASYLRKKILNIAKMYQNEHTRRVGNFQGTILAIIEREKMANTVYAEFEGKQYKIPVGYDEWLRKLYGDYMKLPPKYMQVPKHGGIGYIKDEVDA